MAAVSRLSNKKVVPLFIPKIWYFCVIYYPYLV